MAPPLTPSDIEYMKEHVNDSRTTGMIVSSVVCGVAALLAVILRLVSRRLGHLHLAADDWWMILSLIAIVSQLLYFGNVLTIKLSLLYLYARIFPQRWFRIVLVVFGLVLIAITIAAFAVVIFQCVPIKALWAPTTPARCVDFGRFALAMGVINIITDLAILTLPLPVVWRLRISRTKKVLISITFIVGCCAFVVCLVRLFFVLQYSSTNDPTWDDILSGFISTVELCVGIIAACVPTYKPLFKRLFPNSHLLSILSHRSKNSTPDDTRRPSSTSDNTLVEQFKGAQQERGEHMGRSKNTEEIMLATLVKDDGLGGGEEGNDDQRRLVGRERRGLGE
ncbi:hypothetical protein ACLMJK_008169 [Lecanora helva]